MTLVLPPAYAAVLPLLLLLYLAYNELVRYRSRIPGLPGPRGWPVVGNLFQTGPDVPAEAYRKWARTYGDVFQIQLGNTTAVVVNSVDAAKALFLGQRQAMNSRPTFYVFHKKVSTTVTSIGTSPWDDSCRRRRKAAAGALNRVRVDSYAPILNLEARAFLRDLYHAASHDDGATAIDFRPAVRLFSLNLSLTLNYGTRAASVKTMADDPLLAEIVHVEAAISKLRDTASNYSNYIPLLRYWQPVARRLGLDRTPAGHAADIGRRRLAYNDRLLDRLKDNVARGVDRPCIQGGVLRDPDAAATLTRGELISVSLSMMAGADSNQPTLAWAILLLAHRPDIQATAYRVIADAGVLDLPSSAYAATKVPYIDALTKEISRYFTVLRTALPKATYTEATWQGATIPANTTDPNHFTNPDVFAPERWLDGAPDQHTHQFAFGIGGRMCVASHLAHNALYTVFLHLISRFEIHPADGTTAAEIDPTAGLAKGSLAAGPAGHHARFVARYGSSLEAWLDESDHAEQ